MTQKRRPRLRTGKRYSPPRRKTKVDDKGQHDAVWICMMVESRTGKDQDIAKAAKQISKILKDDLIALHGADKFEDGCHQSYLYIRCSNYWRHVDAMNRRASWRVLPTAENPTMVPDRAMWNLRHRPEESNFRFGDIVAVSGGYLDELRGIVLNGDRPAGFCKIFFRFHTHQFCDSVPHASLVGHGNIFDTFKFPVLHGTART